MLRSVIAMMSLVASSSALGLDGSHAGSWWNPDRGGEGIFFEVIDQGSSQLVIAYFFTYDDDGRQSFLVAQGTVTDQENRVELDANRTSGGRFGSAFDPATIQFTPWGTLVAEFACDTATLSYARGETTGTIDLVRFKPSPRGVGGECAANVSAAGAEVSRIDAAYTGAWWNPERAGEGIFMEITEDADGLPTLFAAWFSYAPDESGTQRWIVGEGPLVGNRADLTAIVTQGARFGAAFDPADVVFAPFDYLSVIFSECGQVQVSYDDPTFGRGQINQQPFVGPIANAPPCQNDRSDYRDQIVYFALTDRFENGDPANDHGDRQRAGDLADRDNPLGWHGGDFAGIAQRIEAGYFEQLGVTTLWISPVYRQVRAVDVGSGPHTGERFAGYHGYWGDDFASIEPHFGDLQELRDLVSTAHRHGLRVILDTVVNHAGYQSSLLQSHPDWLRTGSDCTGSDTGLCLAGLPDFKQEVPAATAFLNDMVRFWMTESGADGMRMDTMKHVNSDYWRQFFVANGAGDPARWWTVGEVFSGEPSDVQRYMDELQSPSVFDFPLHFAIKDGIAGRQTLGRVAEVFTRDGFYDDPTRLTTFVDNHDVRRFISEAENAGATPAAARERLDLALSLIFFARGTPSIYYGTEIAMRGLGDPYDHPLGQSNREDMNFDELANSRIDERLALLARTRRDYPALRYGPQRVLAPSGAGDVLALVRELADHPPIIAVFNNGDQTVDLASGFNGGVDVGGIYPAGTALVEITGKSHELRIVGDLLVGTIPGRTALALTGPP